MNIQRTMVRAMPVALAFWWLQGLPAWAQGNKGEVIKLNFASVKLYTTPSGNVIAHLPRTHNEMTPWPLLDSSDADDAYFKVRTPQGDGWVKKHEVLLAPLSPDAAKRAIVQSSSTVPGVTRGIARP